MKRRDYELIAKVIKKAKYLGKTQKLALAEDFALEIAKNGNFGWDNFKEACGL